MERFRRLGGSLGATTWVAAMVLACGEGGGAPPDDPAHPRPGATTFVSADETRGGSDYPGFGLDGSGDTGGEAPADGGTEDGDADDRTVEEGDVYRAFGGSLLLNLNAYRGLQVIDLSDLANPRIVGRLELSGTPVELYVSGNRAYVLMNQWHGYWGSRSDVTVESYQGGVLLSVDLSDPVRPAVIDQQQIPGSIYRSRLVRGSAQEALYVVAQESGYVEENGRSTWTTATRVESFAAENGRLVRVGSLDLGGWITDVAATPRALLVARSDWTGSQTRSLVSVIDISRPDGTLIEGDTVETEGNVASQFNMDLRGDMLRIVSGNTWSSSSNTNHLEIFDASDLGNLRRIDHETFGAGEQLYATLFLEQAGFFVTYFRTDPFHAFEITPAGDATERSEFVVSGWNVFFRAVFSETRLIGIGSNDQGGVTMAVSLYDVTDLSNPHPLVARAEVAADSSWSEASWDHRAFSVLEGAVSVQAPDGTLETGLVLLPFSGWSHAEGRYESAVQIYTFSPTTLTRRGVMRHGSPVHRTFEVADRTAANLSQEELSLFDISAPDAPEELSRLVLAPNYTGLIPFGSHAVRVREPEDDFGYRGAEARPLLAQIVPSNEHPDSATPVATLEMPAGSSLYRVGANLLAAVHQAPVGTSWSGDWETTIRIWDLSVPSQPRERGSLTTREILPDWGSRYGYGPELAADCDGCGGSYLGYRPGSARVVGNALAFVERHAEAERLGTERICQRLPRRIENGCNRGESCTVIDGYQTCRTLGGTTSCTGGFWQCTWDRDGGLRDCVGIDASQVETVESCWSQEAWRYWHRFEVEVVDLTHADAPRLVHAFRSPRNEEAVSVLVKGDDLWLSFRTPHTVRGDPRPYVRHFSRRIDLTRPDAPMVGGAINLPGQLLALEGDRVFTRDQVWGDRQIEAAVARLRLVGESAVLEAHERFEDQVVETIALDGAGHVLVSHRPGWYGHSVYAGDTASDESGTRAATRQQRLTILDAGGPGLATLASTPVDTWATLRDARVGRALFEVPGGLLVFNLDNPRSPWPQAFFATRGWPNEIRVEGRQILIPAGRFGIHAFDLDETNLGSR